MMHYLLFFLLLCSCWSCDSTTSQQMPAAIEQASMEEVLPATTALSNTVEETTSVAPKDSVEAPSFEVVLQTSSTAKTLLNKGDETFILSITLLGSPKEANTVADKDYYNSYDEVIYLHKKQYTITNPDQVFVFQEQLSKEALEALSNKNYDIIIDGFSGRKSSKNNIFHTSMLSGTINEFQGKKHVLVVQML